MGQAVGTLTELLSEVVVTRTGQASLAEYQGVLCLPELAGDVTVRRDSAGAVFIDAGSEADALVAQGFVHAQDRLWQMELSRRAGRGEVSEILGEAGIETDVAARELGWARLAEDDWSCASKHLQDILTAYARGVNAFIEYFPEKLPVELKLLKATPRPWLPQDSLVIVRLLASGMQRGVFAKVVRAALIEHVGGFAVSEIDLSSVDTSVPSVPDGATSWTRSFDVPGVLRKYGGVEKLTEPVGSNSWAIAGQHSKSGGALLAMDPHLVLNTPNTFHVCHLHAQGPADSTSGNLDVQGATLAGVPYVVMGNSAHAAWGVTVGYHDQEDLYVVEWRDDQRTEYKYDGEWRRASTREEIIVVKDANAQGGSRSMTLHVTETHLGPVVTDQFLPIDEDKPKKLLDPRVSLVLRSVALRPGSLTIEALRGIAFAKDYASWRSALMLIAAPSLHLTYADTQGNIGTFLTGRIPIRKNLLGHLIPLQAASPENDWIGLAPASQQPWSLNPPQGYVFACNHRPVGSSYPYELGAGFKSEWRAKRCHQLLSGGDASLWQESPTLEDMLVMQGDTKSLAGPAFVAAACAQGFFMLEAHSQSLLERLKGWDGDMSVDSAEALLYVVWLEKLSEQVIASQLTPELFQAWKGQGASIRKLSAFLGQPANIMIRLLQSNQDGWWLRKAGGRRHVLRSSFAAAITTCQELCGRDPASWRWGAVHTVTFKHPFGGANKRLASIFNTGPLPVPGDVDTIFMTGLSTLDDGYVTSQGPCYRMAIDLSRIKDSRWVLPAGNSGQPFSRFYSNLGVKWSSVEHCPVHWYTADDRLVDPQGTVFPHVLALSAAPSFQLLTSQTIKDTKGSPAYVAYEIHLTVSMDGSSKPRVVLKRYSEIAAFQATIASVVAASNASVPPMPGKGKVGFDANLVERRRIALNSYLRAVYAKVPVVREAMLAFLGLSKQEIQHSSHTPATALPDPKVEVEARLATVQQGEAKRASRRGLAVFGSRGSRGSQGSRRHSRSSRGSRSRTRSRIGTRS